MSKHKSITVCHHKIRHQHNPCTHIITVIITVMESLPKKQTKNKTTQNTPTQISPNVCGTYTLTSDTIDYACL